MSFIAFVIFYIIPFIVAAFIIRYAKKNGEDDLLITLFKFLSFVPFFNIIFAFVGIVLIFCFSLKESKFNPFDKISKFLWGD